MHSHFKCKNDGRERQIRKKKSFHQVTSRKWANGWRAGGWKWSPGAVRRLSSLNYRFGYSARIDRGSYLVLCVMSLRMGTGLEPLGPTMRMSESYFFFCFGFLCGVGCVIKLMPMV